MTDNKPQGVLVNTQEPDAQFYLVGAGIASMAAAALLIRDGQINGKNITLFDTLEKPGGSLDACGSASSGYVLRGGRMFESKYLCTFDLFASIPTLTGTTTVTSETLEWNKRSPTSSTSRFVRDGRREIAPAFGLTEFDVLILERIVMGSEDSLAKTTIRDHFLPAFFKTPFWLMWATTFAFQPWHSAAEFRRYLLRFTHMIAGFNQLKGIMRTVFNQYESLILPLRKWLESHGVKFELECCIVDIGFVGPPGKQSVGTLCCERDGQIKLLVVAPRDYVLVTLGSMTEASSLGSMNKAPRYKGKSPFGAWALWDKIAAGRPEFGHPKVFSGEITATRWVSFTTTLSDGEFFRRVLEMTGNAPGEGGLITFPDSNWLMSIVLPSQPHFADQPDNVNVFWGYGLRVDEPGNFVTLPMAACSGREVMIELLGHLQSAADTGAILDHFICIPCLMPFVTSQFMPRQPGDRPEILPTGYTHLAFIGQFCEVPDEVVFTVEYSIRSAQLAVSRLLGLEKGPPAIYRGTRDPRVLFKAFKRLHDIVA